VGPEDASALRQRRLIDPRKSGLSPGHTAMLIYPAMSQRSSSTFQVALNPSQMEVALSREKHVVVLAGAGTGKTAAITHKVAHLIRSGVNRREVMMITFTRKAAGEMQKRVGHLIGDVPKEKREDVMLVGTYHALASLLIRRDAIGFGLARSSFTTLDEDDAGSLMKSAFRECEIKPGDFVTPARVRAALSFAVNKRISLDTHFQDEFVENQERAALRMRLITTICLFFGDAVSRRTPLTPLGCATFTGMSSVTNFRIITRSITTSSPI
jgi:hypothetical protein